MQEMLAATDGLAMNFAFTGKGNDTGITALEDIVKAGAAGLKLHEDWGSTPSVIASALDVGDKYDVQVNIHTDGEIAQGAQAHRSKRSRSQRLTSPLRSAG